MWLNLLIEETVGFLFFCCHNRWLWNTDLTRWPFRNENCMNFKRKFKCTSRIEKQDLALHGEKEKSSFQSPRNFVRGVLLVLVQVLVWYWGKLQKSVFWSEMNVYVRTWSELCGWQLVGKFSVYWWGGRKFNPKECNETVFSLQEFTLCFFLCFVIDQVREWTTWCTMSSTYCNSIVYQYLN